MTVPVLPADHPAIVKLRHWRRDPDGPIDFVREQFGVEPDEWQKRFLRALTSKLSGAIRICLLACAGPGKTAALAWAVLWFISTHGEVGKHPKGVCFSCNADNLRDNLWAEIGKWLQRSKFLQFSFEYTKERLFNKQYPEDWFISARTFSQKANPEEIGRTLSGLHGAYVGIFGDETASIPVQMLKTAEQAMSNVELGLIAQAGNPIDLGGMLHESAIIQREKWIVIEITGDPDDPARSPRVDVEWARDQIQRYGRDNPWVMAYVLGKFPPSSINTLLSIEDVQEAMRRKPPYDSYAFAQKRIGVDVARFGDDRTCIVKRQGSMVWQPIILRNLQSDEIAGRVVHEKREFKSEVELVDDTGHWGHGTIDCLRTWGHNPVAVLFHGKPDDPRYGTKRDEMWMRMAEWVKTGGSLPKDCPDWLPELTQATYTYVNGKLKVEDKDSMKKRLGRSPDVADGLCCSFAILEMPTSVDELGRKLLTTPGREATSAGSLESDPYKWREPT